MTRPHQSPDMMSDQPPEVYRKRAQTERERTSTKLCVVGLVICWLVGLAFLACGVYLVCTGSVLADRSWAQRRVHGPNGKSHLVAYSIPCGIAVAFNKYTQELAPLGLNIVITVCNDITGYIHTVSLRWARQKESRLTFNSNLRLFTSARRSKSNAWYTNLTMAIFMIMSYASTSMIFIGDSTPSYLSRNTNVFICGYRNRFSHRYPWTGWCGHYLHTKSGKSAYLESGSS